MAGDIPKTLKKLREAKFFLGWMEKAARSTNLEREDFEFYFSAFLSAGRSVTFVLQKEQKNLYEARYGPWESGLTPKDQSLMKFMNEQRVAELHLLGANVEAAIEMVPMTVFEMERGIDLRYTMSWYGSTDAPPPEIGRKVHYFEHATGKQVLSTCTQYFRLLESCAREFDAAFEYPIY
jgi:hypothetical protein